MNKKLIVGVVAGVVILTVACNMDSAKEGYEDAKEEVKQEEVVQEPEVKEEPKEVVGEQVPVDIDTVNNTVLQILKENFAAPTYDVGLIEQDGTICINVLSYDLDSTGLTKEQIQYSIDQANIDSTFTGLADSIKNVYSTAGYNVTIMMGISDCNGNLVYTTIK